VSSSQYQRALLGVGTTSRKAHKRGGGWGWLGISRSTLTTNGDDRGGVHMHNMYPARVMCVVCSVYYGLCRLLCAMCYVAAVISISIGYVAAVGASSTAHNVMYIYIVQCSPHCRLPCVATARGGSSCELRHQRDRGPTTNGGPKHELLARLKAANTQYAPRALFFCACDGMSLVLANDISARTFLRREVVVVVVLLSDCRSSVMATGRSPLAGVSGALAGRCLARGAEGRQGRLTPWRPVLTA
jgi:hypothetical protein